MDTYSGLLWSHESGSTGNKRCKDGELHLFFICIRSVAKQICTEKRSRREEKQCCEEEPLENNQSPPEECTATAMEEQIMEESCNVISVELHAVKATSCLFEVVASCHSGIHSASWSSIAVHFISLPFGKVVM